MAKKYASRGVLSPVDIKCERCGGTAMYQEWIESSANLMQRFGIVFCQNCDMKSRLHSERTARETKQEALNDWKILQKIERETKKLDKSKIKSLKVKK